MHPFKTRSLTHGNAFRLAVLLAWGVLGMGLLSAQPKNLQAIEMAKRQAMVEEARELVGQGDLAIKKDRPGQAFEAYAGARELVPDVPALKEVREAITERFIAAALSQAAVLANRGDLKGANAMVDRVLEKGVAPKDASAIKMKEMLNDPVRVNPAIDPEHVADVEAVNRLILKANGAVALGRYNLAAQTYEDILRIDRHNVLARRGLVQVLSLKRKASIAAYDQTRAEMLFQVGKQWELPVRPKDEQAGQPIGVPFDEDPKDVSVEAKLRRIKLPSVALNDVNLSDAIEFLRVASSREDLLTEDQNKRGINFNINIGSEDSPVVQQIKAKRFNLNLRDVPVDQVLKYITELTGTAYKTDAYSVTIISLGQVTDEVYMRRYPVPPDFISALSDGAGGGAAEVDPFAAVQPSQGLLTEQLPVQELLQRKGVSFGEGANATYIAASNQLLVVNTAKNHGLIEAIVDIIKKADPIVVSVQVTMIKAQEKTLEELGFDWLLQPFSLGSGAVLGGGTPGNMLGRLNSDLGTPLMLFGGPEAVANDVITNGLRSGDQSFVANSIDAIINNPTRAAQTSRVSPGILALTGVFNNTQAQMIMRGLSQSTGIDTMARPSVVTRNGESAKITLAREFIYPTEYDPPELQQGGGGNQFGNGGGGGGGGPAFPVVPANPTAFEMREVGISLEVLPVADENKRFIGVTLNPEIVEFDGFVNYGSPITVPVPGLAGGISRVTLTENQILMPVFSTKRAATQLTVADGATVAFGGMLTQSIQSVEDKVPVLGDIPLLGSMFSSKSHLPISTAVVFLVKVDLMDPTGRLYRELSAP